MRTMAISEKRLLRKCKCCEQWKENVHPYETVMMCPECATKSKYKVKQKDSEEDKKN